MKKLLTAVASLCAFDAFADTQAELKVVANIDLQTSIERTDGGDVNLFGKNTAQFKITNNGAPVKVVVENATIGENGKVGDELCVKSDKNYIKYTAQIDDADIVDGHEVCKEINEETIDITFKSEKTKEEYPAGRYEGTAVVKLVAVEEELPDMGVGLDH